MHIRMCTLTKTQKKKIDSVMVVGKRWCYYTYINTYMYTYFFICYMYIYMWKWLKATGRRILLLTHLHAFVTLISFFHWPCRKFFFFSPPIFRILFFVFLYFFSSVFFTILFSNIASTMLLCYWENKKINFFFFFQRPVNKYSSIVIREKQ